VPGVELKSTATATYREVAPADPQRPAVLLAHGFPESSRMWIPVMEALGDRHRCVAPDLYCLGDSTDPGPATFERNREALGELHGELGLGKVVLVVHDWGGFVGLAWACEHPESVAALVISDTGFFSDGRWHDMAEAIRAEGGEALLENLEREGFAALLRADGAEFSDEDVDAYWKPFAEGRGREATVEFYRSMDFEKLAPYEGKLAELAVPTLLLWGAEDRFARMGGAKRFEREIPGAELIAVEGAGHFVYETEPERCGQEISSFLSRL
jgi:haloalkane dehalogenase